ncbi:carbohydrate ABC transporter permease [Paenibacillus beijingensis]|uniref:carbohydrate ABC transporter permease n=1 Tax=Paenibacillus beijingensis TaxID=1126833 RepID=UPI000AB0EBC1|nr:sugar ABC transporter permease [Paenibacillus beijingensis]
MKLRSRERWTSYLSLAPMFLYLLLLMAYPLGSTFYHSFTRWNGVESHWVGMDNYIDIFKSGELLRLLRTNLIMLLSVPGILMICLVIAVLMFEKVPGTNFFRMVYYLPSTLSAVVVGYLMRTMFSPVGPVNQWLQFLGMDMSQFDWLSNVPTAFLVLIFCFYWQTVGYGMLIFLSGLSSLPNEVLEAARIDGANWRTQLIRIVIPLLLPAIVFFCVTNVIWVFVGLFSLVFTVTGGGPGYETTPIDYMIFLKAFQSDQLGYASTLSVILFVLVLCISWIQLRVSERFSD